MATSSVVSWGAPKVEFGVSTGVEATSYNEFDSIKQDSAILTTTKGQKRQLFVEGGKPIATKYDDNQYTFDLGIFHTAGTARHIAAVDGKVADSYTVRLTPEDPKNWGFRLDFCTVSVAEAWTSAEGTVLTYTFEAQTPTDGSAMFKDYVAPVGGS